MTWDQGLLCVHGYNNGGQRRIRATQINATAVEQLSGDTLQESTDTLGPFWVINTVTIGGATFPEVLLAGVFVARPNNASDVQGSVSLDVQMLDALDDDGGTGTDLRNLLIDAFIDGGTVVLGVGTDAADDPLTVHLRALSTTDFELESGVARPVYPAGTSEPNLTVPATDTISNYVYSTPNGEFGTGPLESNAEGEITLSQSAPEFEPGSHKITLQIAATSLDAWSQLSINLQVPPADDPQGEGGAPNDDPSEGGSDNESDGSGGDDDELNGSGGTQGMSSGDGDGTTEDGDGTMSGPGGSSAMDGGDEMGPGGDPAGCGCHTGRASPSGLLWLTTPAALLWLRMRRPIPRDRAWWKKI